MPSDLHVHWRSDHIMLWASFDVRVNAALVAVMWPGRLFHRSDLSGGRVGVREVPSKTRRVFRQSRHAWRIPSAIAQLQMSCRARLTLRSTAHRGSLLVAQRARNHRRWSWSSRKLRFLRSWDHSSHLDTHCVRTWPRSSQCLPRWPLTTTKGCNGKSPHEPATSNTFTAFAIQSAIVYGHVAL